MQNQKGNISVIVTFIVVALIVGFVVYALMHKTEVTSEDTVEQNVAQTGVNSESTSTQKLQENQNKSQKTMETKERTLSNFTPVSGVSKLEKIDTVVGKGAEVTSGATVSVHYTGAVAATGVVFQSSKDFGETPITFPLSGVIKGWTDGIPGMKIGGTRRLIIPAAQAYGANPPQGSGIPANADLVFDVELVAIK